DRGTAQRVVDGCARKRAQLEVCALFRYRLASAEIGSARQGFVAYPERPVWAHPRARRASRAFRGGHLLSPLRRAQTANRAGHIPLSSGNRAAKSRGIQGRRFLRGIAKHSDRARIFTEAY